MDTNKGKVLIVDDEPGIREGFRHIFDWDGLGLALIGTASSGEEALSIIREVSPDIVISDIVMQGISGLQLIQETRDAGNTDTQFILISGYNEFKYAQKAISLGVAAYILKPIDKAELEDALIRIRQKKLPGSSPVDIGILQRNARHLFIQHLINGEIRSSREVAEGIQNFGVRLEDADSTAITIADRNGRTLSGCRSALDYIKVNHAEAIEDKGRTIIIINGSERVALHFTRQILEMLSKDGYGGFIAGVGSTVPSLADISSSYAQSIAAISYHAYWEDRRIFTGDDISKDRPALSTSSLDIDKLKDLITRSDIEGIKDYMGNFFQALLFAKTPPPSYVKGMLLFLMNGIERGIAEAEDIEMRQLEEARPDLADPMLLMDEIRSSVTGYFITISQALLPEARLSSDRIIRECRKYVQEHLYGRIAEDELASALGLSQPYLSAYFSRRTGETFRSYVNRIRNEEAKQLLAQGMSIDEVSEKLGYSDYRSFHRIFKKMNGESPSQWKKRSAR